MVNKFFNYFDNFTDILPPPDSFAIPPHFIKSSTLISRAFATFFKVSSVGFLFSPDSIISIIVARKKSKTIKCSEMSLRSEKLDEQLSSLIKKVSLPKDWAEELNRLALQDHKNSAPSLTACVKESETKLSVISQKLERLLTGYLDQVIDEQDYRTEKGKLILQKKSLEEEMTTLSHTQNDWLAPVSWRKNPPSRRRRESEFVWKIRRNSVGVPTARPLLGWFSTAKFHSGARGGSRTHMPFDTRF